MGGKESVREEEEWHILCPGLRLARRVLTRANIEVHVLALEAGKELVQLRLVASCELAQHGAEALDRRAVGEARRSGCRWRHGCCCCGC